MLISLLIVLVTLFPEGTELFGFWFNCLIAIFSSKWNDKGDVKWQVVV